MIPTITYVPTPQDLICPTSDPHSCKVFPHTIISSHSANFLLSATRHATTSALVHNPNLPTPTPLSHVDFSPVLHSTVASFGNIFASLPIPSIPTWFYFTVGFILVAYLLFFIWVNFLR